jgi:transcriptional regulator with XRE-family HTH domain
MESAGIGQRELARQLRVSPSSVGRWLRGASGIEGETLVRLCHALHTSTAFLMGAHHPAADEQEPLQAIINEMVAMGLDNEAAVLDAIQRVPEHQRPQFIERMRGMVDGFLAAQPSKPPPGHHGPNGNPPKPRLVK